MRQAATYSFHSGATRILAHGIVFGLLGPPIGTVLSLGVIVYPFAVMFSYMTSTIPAILAGLTIGAVSLFERNEVVLKARGALIGAAFGATAVIAFPYYWNAMWIVMHAISGAFAGALCTRLTKWLRQETAR